MIHLLLSLMFSISFATDGCDELLSRVAQELEAARIENRSRLIKGIISKEQYERVLAQIEEQEKELSSNNLGLKFTSEKMGSRAFSQPEQKNTTLSEKLKLRHIHSIRDVPGSIMNIDYSPTEDAAVLEVEISNISSELFLYKDMNVSQKPIQTGFMTEGYDSIQVFPNIGKLAYVENKGRTYTLHLDKDLLVPISRYSDPKIFEHAVSFKGSWLYPKKLGVGSELQLHSLKHKFILEGYYTNTSDDQIYDVVIDNNEEYILLYSADEVVVYSFKRGEYKKIFFGDSAISSAAINTHNNDLKIMYDRDLLTVSLEDIFRQKERIVTYSDGKLNFRRVQIFLKSQYLVGSPIFSPDGSFMFYKYGSQGHTGGQGINVMETVMNKMVSEDFIFGGRIHEKKYKFTTDSLHLIRYDEGQADIFTFLGSNENEVID